MYNPDTFYVGPPAALAAEIDSRLDRFATGLSGRARYAIQPVGEGEYDPVFCSTLAETRATIAELCAACPTAQVVWVVGALIGCYRPIGEE